MKRDNDEMKPKLEVSLRILPFGSIGYKITGLEHPVGEEEHGRPRYIEPLTTNIEEIEIRYEVGETYGTYLVPKTTAGV